MNMAAMVKGAALEKTVNSSVVEGKELAMGRLLTSRMTAKAMIAVRSVDIFSHAKLTTHPIRTAMVKMISQFMSALIRLFGSSESEEA